MGNTEGKVTQSTPNTDLCIFCGPSGWVDTSGGAAYTQVGLGLYSLRVPAAAASQFIVDELVFNRTGEYAIPSLAQEQFGTAAAQPGPSLVANTSSPLALPPGYPPIVAANMATIAGSINGTGVGVQRGPIKKGMYATFIDVIYQVNAVAATLAQFGATLTVWANGVAPVVTPIVALGVNGLLLPASATPYVITIPIPGQFQTAPDTEITVKVNLTAGAGGTIDFFGTVTRFTYNFN
jgi:hypothetical protein